MRSYGVIFEELRSYHSLCSLGVKPYARELIFEELKELFLRSYGVILEELKELRSYHSLRSLGVKPYARELWSEFF